MSIHLGPVTRFAAVALLAIGSMLGMTNPIQAATIPFDPDGGGNGFINIDSLDFSPGNSLFQGLGTLLGHPATPAAPDPAVPTLLRIQTRVGNLNNASLGDLTPGALNNSYELTMYMEVPVTSTFDGNFTDFAITSANTGTFELWYDSTNNSDSLAGTGFRDGTKILDGKFNSADGSFSNLTPFTGVDTFDKFGVDNYAGFQTQQIAGGGSFDVNIGTADAGFFGIVPPQLKFLVSTTDLATPFSSSNPSKLFSGYAPILGNQNGQGPDFQAQADAAASFDVIPEPSTWLLLSVAAMAGLAWGRRR
jgi:hypothetical protein